MNIQSDEHESDSDDNYPNLLSRWSWLGNSFVCLFLLFVPAAAFHLIFFGFSALTDVIELSEQICSVTVYINSQSQVYSAKRGSIAEGWFVSSLSFVDKNSQQRLAFGDASYSISCPIVSEVKNPP